MVLVKKRIAAPLAWVLLLGLAGCLKSQPVQRLEAAQPMTVVVVHDHRSKLGVVPDALQSNIQSTLNARNLVMQEVPRPQYESDFAVKRATRDRMRTLSGLATNSTLQLLVETRAEYYSQLNGRFRWTVYVKFSMAKSGDPSPPTISSFSFPVLLSFDHQREADALSYAAGSIARKLGQELDEFLAGLDFKIASAPSPAPKVPELESVYFVMVDRFANGDPDNDGEIDLADPQAFHGGDLKGLIGKLDHIAAMGFRTVWLSPLFSMRTEKIGEHGAFHGYWTEDLREVEQRFGSTEDLLRLKEELGKRDMKLVMDMVLNHVGYDTKLVKEQPGWFHAKGDIKDWDDPVQLTTHDVHGLPDLAQENPEVYEYLLSASAQWVENLEPIGFRLDAVKHVGSAFWTQYTKEIQAQSDGPLAMIGELYNGDPAVIAKGFLEDGFSHLFDFPLYFAMDEVFCKGEHMGRLASILSLDRLYPDPSRLITFADNHDLPRVWSACGENTQRVEALLTFMLSARGVPSINYGTEVPLAGSDDPANRKDMDFSVEAPLAALIEKMLALRTRHEVLRAGKAVPLTVNQYQFSYLRVGEEESALIALNLGDEAWSLSHALLADGGAVDALDGQAISGGSLTVPAGSTRVVLIPATSKGAYQELLASSKLATPMQKMVVLAEAEHSELRLVGGGPELGNWNPAMAPRGKRVSDGRFRFELSMPLGSTGAFKLVSTGEGAAQWEERGNRFLTATKNAASPTEIHFGKTEEIK
jgi:glycosidase